MRKVLILALALVTMAAVAGVAGANVNGPIQLFGGARYQP